MEDPGGNRGCALSVNSGSRISWGRLQATGALCAPSQVPERYPQIRLRPQQRSGIIRHPPSILEVVGLRTSEGTEGTIHRRKLAERPVEIMNLQFQ